MNKISRSSIKYLSLFSLMVLLLLGCGDPSADESGDTEKTSVKAINGYSVISVGNTASADTVFCLITGMNISCVVQDGTDVTNLVATFEHTGSSIRVGSIEQISEHTINDFSNAVIYTVMAEDETTADYTVTVTSTPSNSDPVVIDSIMFQHVSQEGGTDSFEYSYSLGSTPQDVFFIFTNSKSSDVSTPSTINSLQSESVSVLTKKMPTIKSSLEDSDLLSYAREHGIGLRGTPKATAFNANPPHRAPIESGASYQQAAPEPRFYEVNVTSHAFMNESESDTIPSTLRKIVTDGTITLNIWVADDSWISCSKWYCLTQAMVDAFANKFLRSGSNNDIYDWVTNIFGVPWGSHEYGNLIDATAAQSIDILFFDIDRDGDLTDPEPDGGRLGFFYGKDTYLVSEVGHSNERLLFYMDSVLAATETDTSWEIYDDWPADMVSVMAHEFQHMIHMYQKGVKYNVDSEVWINEMASMITEDLLADKIEVIGPRGVSHADSTAGNSGNFFGRLPRFNSNNYIGPTVWNEGEASLVNYSINYAFGAYLARNFGGAVLFQKIVQSKEADYRAIAKAVKELGYNETFSTLLQKWGVSVLLSDQINLSNGYRYNTGSSFNSSINGITYNLGSVNLFNYSDNVLNGPYFHTPSTLLNQLGKHYKLSNTYVQVGSAETGTFTKEINMSENVNLSVVIKPSGSALGNDEVKYSMLWVKDVSTTSGYCIHCSKSELDDYLLQNSAARITDIEIDEIGGEVVYSVVLINDGETDAYCLLCDADTFETHVNKMNQDCDCHHRFNSIPI